MNGKFWMVWSEGKNIPVVKHGLLKPTLREAERIANKEPGSIVYVLESVSMKYIPQK